MFSNRAIFVLILIVLGLEVVGQVPRPVPADYDVNIPKNYIRVWDLNKPVQYGDLVQGLSVPDVKQTTQYFDGLGRGLQTVVKQGSLETSTSQLRDLVVPVEYNIMGREEYKYLPLVPVTVDGYEADGNFKRNAFSQQASFYSSYLQGQNETFFYSHTVFENDPLGRPKEAYAAGNSWAGSEGTSNTHSVAMKYWFNTAADNVKIWDVTNYNGNLGEGFGTYSLSSSFNGVYPAGSLYKNVTEDENKSQVIEFKDKGGRVILKKVQVDKSAGIADDGTGRGYTGWLSTYYIYDNLGRLRCVIQPEGVKLLEPAGWSFTSTVGLEVLDKQCFRYEYDSRGRMIIKRIPGSGNVYMVYDSRDRLTMIQDANLRGTNHWIVSHYDAVNRIVETRKWQNSGTFNSHLLAALASTSDYPTVSSNYDVLSRAHYDDYNGIPSGLSSYLSTWNANFLASTNSWPYVETPQASTSTKGMPTWSQVNVLGSPNVFLNSVVYYDSKGRNIQTQSTNISGGLDVQCTQYSWAGLPILKIEKQQMVSATNPSEHLVSSKYNYDNLGRLLTISKSVNSTINSVAVSKAETEVAKYSYDRLGQMKVKQLGKARDMTNGTYTSNPLETLDFDYNIRGWLLGINRASLATAGQGYGKKFGFELGYDKLTNTGGQSFSSSQFNGNISGMIWKSDGDDVRRKYDFSYDPANRLLKALFIQDNSLIGSWDNTQMNYSVLLGDGIDPAKAYDNNGNIKGMTQYGWKLGAGSSFKADELKYTYELNSNRLKSVTDFVNNPVTRLGDFRTANSHPQFSTKAQLNSTSLDIAFLGIQDYSYDNNGNLTQDLNKGIQSITYNYMNLPELITFLPAENAPIGSSRTIQFTYDASGKKLKKVIFEIAGLNTDKTTTTTYVGAFEYETKVTNPFGGPDPTDHTDLLQQIGFEEGRIRFKPAVQTTPASFEMDYFVKDHLGNVRMVLTDEWSKYQYIPASMEDAIFSGEQEIYSNLPSTKAAKPSNYPYDPYTPVNDYVAKVQGNGNKMGPAIVLKVMAGDIVDVRVSSWYDLNGQNLSGPSPITELANALANSIAGKSGGKATSTEITASGVSSNAASGFLGSQSYDPAKPKAYLNWVLLDEQFNIARSASNQVMGTGYSGFDQVGSDLEFKTHTKNLDIYKSGYIYIYVSNETPNIPVYFDNLQVTHTRGAISSEDHYYPFGLAMAGLKSKALGFADPGNKLKYNGKEEQNNEFGDGVGLDWMDYGARMYDNQIGRWHHIDPHLEYYSNQSPYNYVMNMPLIATDPNGMDTYLSGQAAQDLFRLLQNSSKETNIDEADNMAQSVKDQHGGESTDNFTIDQRGFKTFDVMIKGKKVGVVYSYLRTIEINRERAQDNTKGIQVLFGFISSDPNLKTADLNWIQRVKTDNVSDPKTQKPNEWFNDGNAYPYYTSNERLRKEIATEKPTDPNGAGSYTTWFNDRPDRNYITASGKYINSSWTANLSLVNVNNKNSSLIVLAYGFSIKNGVVTSIEPTKISKSN